MIKDVEGKKKSEALSLAHSWRWLKGLLFDFIKLKKDIED
jgi:hypothetical protein